MSTQVDPRELFGGVRAVVVDELHAFAGDDRGWHLLAVLERLSRIAGRELQRIGLSATVGNPDELLTWLRAARERERRRVIALAARPRVAEPEITVDFVGSIANAAQVIASLHRGEKRLVFVDSRARPRNSARHCGNDGIETFVSHSSLSAG